MKEGRKEGKKKSPDSWKHLVNQRTQLEGMKASCGMFEKILRWIFQLLATKILLKDTVPKSCL